MKKAKYQNHELKRVLEVNIFIDNIRHSFVNLVDRRSNLISKMKRLNNLRNSSEIKKTKKSIEDNITRILPENSPYLKKLFVSKGSDYNKISNNFLKEINKINSPKSEKNLIIKEGIIENIQAEIIKSPMAANSSVIVVEESNNKKNIIRSNSDVKVNGLPKISNSYKNLHYDKSFILNEVQESEAKRLNSFFPVENSRESSTKLKRENFNFYKFKAKMNELLYPEKHKDIETIRKYSPLYNKQIKNLIENPKLVNSQLEMYRNRIRNLKKNSNTIEEEEILKKHPHLNNYKEFKNYSNNKGSFSSLKLDFNLGRVSPRKHLAERKDSGSNQKGSFSLPRILK